VHGGGPQIETALNRLGKKGEFIQGHWAKQMNQSLAGLLIDEVGRTMHGHPDTTTSEGMAVDGIHPSAVGYAAWADGLSRCILTARAPGTTRSA